MRTLGTIKTIRRLFIYHELNHTTTTAGVVLYIQGCQFSDFSLISDFMGRKGTGIKLIKFFQNRDKSS